MNEGSYALLSTGHNTSGFSASPMGRLSKHGERGVAWGGRGILAQLRKFCDRFTSFSGHI
jgi:hypothetical protein